MATLFEVLNIANPAQSVQPNRGSNLMNIAASLGNTASRGITQATGGDIRSQQQKVVGATQGLDPEDPDSMLVVAQKLDAVGETARATQIRQMAVQKKTELDIIEAMQGLDPEDPNSMLVVAQKLDSLGESARATEIRQIAATKRAELNSAQSFKETSQELAAGLTALGLHETADLALSGSTEGYETASTIYINALDEKQKALNSGSGAGAGIPKPPLPLAQQEAIISQMRGQGATPTVLENLSQGLSSGAVQSFTDASRYLPIRDPLPDSAQRVLTATNERSAEARTNFSEASAVLENIYNTDLYADYRGGEGLYDATGGFVTDLSITLQNFLGGRTKYGLVRERFNRIVNSEAITNLPPGSTTEKELEIVKRGFPADNANLGQMIIFLEALKKVSVAAEEDAELQSRFYDGRAYFSGDIQQGEWSGFRTKWYDMSKKLEQDIKEQQALLDNSVSSPEAKAQSEREIEFLKAQFKQFVAISLSGGDERVDPEIGFLPRGFE